MLLDISLFSGFYLSLRRSAGTNILIFTYTLVLLLYYFGLLFSSVAPNIGHPHYPEYVVTKEAISAFRYSMFIYLSTSIYFTKKSKYRDKSQLGNFVITKSFLSIFFSTISGIVLVVLTQNNNLIWLSSYGTESWSTQPIIDSVLLKNIGLMCLSIGSFMLLASNYKQRKLIYRLCVIFVLYETLFRGDRGGLITFMSGTFAYLIIQKKYRLTLLISFIVILISFMWRTIRWQWYIYGFKDSLDNSFGTVTDLVKIFDSSNIIFYTIPVLPQASWHWFHVHELARLNGFLGVSRIPILLAQIIPSFLIDAVGFERPVNLAWLLAEYASHGGGMNHIASVYWIGGYFAVFLFSILLLGFFRFLVRKFHNTSYTSNFILTSFAVTFLYSFFYGLQPFIKLTELFIILLYINYWYGKKSIHNK